VDAFSTLYSCREALCLQLRLQRNKPIRILLPRMPGSSRRRLEDRYTPGVSQAIGFFSYLNWVAGLSVPSLTSALLQCGPCVAAFTKRPVKLTFNCTLPCRSSLSYIYTIRLLPPFFLSYIPPTALLNTLSHSDHLSSTCQGLNLSKLLRFPR
jgi:hypothetical protein